MLLWGVAGGCASDRPPSGGPVDNTPLRILSSDTRHSNGGLPVTTVHITFSHPVSGRELLKSLVFSPSIDNYDLSVRARTAEIRIYEPLKPAATYRVILNKYMRDARGKNLDNTGLIAFSAGTVFDRGVIAGRVYHHNLKPAPEALLLAYAANRGTEPDYLVQAGADGSFILENLAEGHYLVFAVNDTNRNLRFEQASEAVAVADRVGVSVGTTSLMLRFAPDGTTPDIQPTPAEETEPEKTGTLSGSCRADAQALTIEARRHKDNASFLTAAMRAAKGVFHYSFSALPPGTYTISASIPSAPKRSGVAQAWKPGSLDPFTASETFGVYPDTVRIRPGWITDAIDFTLR
ncbi:MAG: Ig-like domain-containing protein [Chlorobium sp.]|uniref:Ig-like domain-containing protein n=1 Tax=Chlorobium sp. TaxID=1095 RepID=UPI0025BD4117|nr:Ig-like domain-containing protein [Chlorobium sp.]MCF8383159.1 Ig-like domain-containing protein [Chlorobium sp.]